MLNKSKAKKKEVVQQSQQLLDQQKQEAVNIRNKSKGYLLSKDNILTEPKPKFTGDISIENYATNAQNPLMLNSPYYSRVYFSPTFTLYGLPFTADVYYTTEDNSLYNSNTFSFNFDIQTFKDNISKELEKEIGAKKRLDRIREFDLKNNLNQKDKIQSKIDALKKEIPNINDVKDKADNQVNESKDQLKKKALDEKEKAKLKAKDELDKGKSDAMNYKKFAPKLPISFKLAIKLIFLNINIFKDYKSGYKQSYFEIIEARKTRNSIKDIEANEEIITQRKKEIKRLKYKSIQIDIDK